MNVFDVILHIVTQAQNKGVSPQARSPPRLVKLITDSRDVSHESALKENFDSERLNCCLSFVRFPFKSFQHLSQAPKCPPSEARVKLYSVKPFCL